jgi:hypothetical protein
MRIKAGMYLKPRRDSVIPYIIRGILFAIGAFIVFNLISL